MDKNLVIIKNEELMVGTWNLSKGFQMEHRLIKTFIKKYEKDFEELGSSVTSQMQRIADKKGGQIEEYLLNEGQAIYLTTLLRNNDIVRKFKMHLTKAFLKQRKLLNQILVQRQNTEWLAKRESGKIERRIETDTIKEFVEYATDQGSSNASKYYMIISKMENNALLSLEFLEQEFPNLRDVVDGFALDALKMADHTVARALREGMEKQMNYKDVYILARDRVEMLAMAVGKTPLSLFNIPLSILN